MSTKFLHILAIVLAACSAFGTLDLTGVIAVVPNAVAQWLTFLPLAVMTLGHFILAWGDQLDDGQRNNSFPGSVKCHPLAFLAALLITVALTSCAGFRISASTPWGDVHSVDGTTTVTPIIRPIVIPDK